MAYGEQNITLGATLPVLTKRGNFICEFDCEIDFACWESDRDEWDWEPRTVRMTSCSLYKEHSFDDKSDPAMWEVVLRALKHEDDYIAERIHELLREAA